VKDGQTARILVIDDEAMLRRIIQAHLSRANYETITAANGAEGIELARRERPALILLDVMMPEMNGYEVARVLRSDWATSQIPIIMLTAKHATEDKMVGLEAGANDYITKPFDSGELLARITTVLTWSERQRAANPLTGLPGNITIETELEKIIGLGQPFAVVYVDLDNFKAYNDYYGYNEGDQAIRDLARILMTSCQTAGDGSEFIGHIGGDDFLFVASPDCAERIARKVIARFEESLDRLIRPEDRERGWFEVEGRTGEMKRFPLLSITLAMVTSDGGRIGHVAEVGDLASEVKRYGKSIEGSVLVRDRRQRGGEGGIQVLAGTATAREDDHGSE